MKLTLGRIGEFIRASGGFDTAAAVMGHSIDSRTVQPGELFYAVKGERLDGHEYVNAALERGAVGAVVAKEHAPRFTHRNILVVEDTLIALQTAATAVRRLWGKQVIAVTGSAGKTTTKEAISHLLAKRFRVLRSQGNLNNHFGLPLQLLKLESEHEIAVVELGMSALGEIAELGKIARPDIGVVTCVAAVHLQNFNSIADIARAKYELIQSLPSGGTAILNADDEFVSQFGRDFHGKVVTYGIKRPADISARDLKPQGEHGTTFTLVMDGVNEEVRLPLLGNHNVMNALAAVAAATQCGMQPTEIKTALAELAAPEKRGQTFKLRGATIVNDCYNSNPTALDAMVDALSALHATRRIVVAGEMLELGPTGAELHARCGRNMAGKVDRVIGVRGLAEHLVNAAKQAGLEATFVADPQLAGELLARELQAGDAVLLKASRGVRLEAALDVLTEKLGQPA